MNTNVREETQAIWVKVVDLYFDEGHSINCLAKDFGYSASSVSKQIAAEKVKNPDRQRLKQPKDSRRHTEKKSLSQVHFQIGLAVSLYRSERQYNPTGFGNLVGMSRTKVRNIEIGCHDLTLTEIIVLARVMGMTFDDLVSTTKKG